MYMNLDELKEGYLEIPKDQRSSFRTYVEQMMENDLYGGPQLTEAEILDVESEFTDECGCDCAS